MIEDRLAELRRRIDDPVHAAKPRHARLRSAIVGLLSAGAWSPGDKLPSETEIARASGLSLGTAQKALAQLARDGFLVRRHGHGTFAAGDALQPRRLLHFRFVGDDGAVIAPVYAKAIDRRVISAPGPWSSCLSGVRRFIRIRRRITVAEEFDCLSELYIDAERFAPILDLPMRELHLVTIRTILAERFDTPTIAVDQSVYATLLPSAVVRLLKLAPERRFGLVLEVRSQTHERRPFAFQNIFIPPDVRPLKIVDPTLGPA